MNVNEMDADALRHAIAEALGWRFETIMEDVTLYGSSYVIKTDEIPIRAWTAPGGTRHKSMAILDELPFPDWPNDAGAALSLCVSLGDFSLNHCDPTEWPGEWEAIMPKEDGYEYGASNTVYANTPALALARLALMALREGHND